MSEYLLSIDDDLDFGALLMKTLKELDVKSVHTTNVEDFYNKFQESLPKVCLIDVDITKRGEGFELVHSIRSKNSSLPIIVMSGRDDVHDIHKAIKVGANDFIRKPLNKKILANKLDDYILVRSLSEDMTLPMHVVIPDNRKCQLYFELEVCKILLKVKHK